MKEIDKKVMQTFNKCESCGYEKGFHIMLSPIKFSERTAVKLVCPNCGQVYHIGWSVQLEL